MCRLLSPPVMSSQTADWLTDAWKSVVECFNFFDSTFQMINKFLIEVTFSKEHVIEERSLYR